MMNLAGQYRVVLNFGRLHQVFITASAGDGHGIAIAGGTSARAPTAASVTASGTESAHQAHCTRRYHNYRRVAQGSSRPRPPLIEAGCSCRVPCQPRETCSHSHTCLRFFGLSSPLQALTKSSAVLPDDKPGIMTRVLDSVGIPGKLRFNRFKMRVAGLNMYEACADGYNFETFFRACNMPDTLFSWFLVMELHVWLCMARLKQEGREGKYMTHYLILSMWHDIQQRGSLMGIPSVKMKESLSKMVEQFNGALFAYDEGLMSSDKVLAAALWRNLFLRNCEDPEMLANMVEYVRQQMQYLDSLDSSKLLQVGRIKWLPYRGGVPHPDRPLPRAASLEDELDIPDGDKVPVA